MRISTLIKLAVAVGGMLLATNFVLSYVASHSPVRLAAITEGNIDVTTLISGNSRPVRFILGEPNDETNDFFNLAYRSTKRPDTIALIKDYFELGNRAKVVLIEVSALTRDDVSCQLKTYWPWLTTLREAHREGCADDAWSSSLFPITRFNTQLFRRSAVLWLSGKKTDQFRLDDFNNRISERRCSRLPVRNVERAREDFAEADYPAIMRELEGLEQWFVEQGIDAELALVLGPYVQLDRTKDAIGDIKRAAAENFSRWPYLDLSTVVAEGCDGFGDATHLNTKGIRFVRPKINEFLEPWREPRS